MWSLSEQAVAQAPPAGGHGGRADPHPGQGIWWGRARPITSCLPQPLQPAAGRNPSAFGRRRCLCSSVELAAASDYFVALAQFQQGQPAGPLPSLVLLPALEHTHVCHLVESLYAGAVVLAPANIAGWLAGELACADLWVLSAFTRSFCAFAQARLAPILPSLPRSLTTLPAAPSRTLCAAACYLQVNAAVRAGEAYLRDVLLLYYPGEVIAAAAALGLRRVLKAAGRLVRRQFLRLADVHGLPAIASWLALMPKAQVGWGSQQACCGAAGPCGAGRTARL